jgi:NTP pyrophosphatase (non-canonical NTP hydrolase)
MWGMMDNIIQEIKTERIRQDNKWGEQNHGLFTWSTILGEECGEVCKGALEYNFGNQTIDNYRKELIEVAAVAIAAIECLDRNKWK